VTLATYGVDVLLVERRVEGSGLPRATGLSLRSMELIRSWGLEERVLAGGVDAELSLYELPTVVRAAEGRRIEVGFPTAAQSVVLSPVTPACVPQDHLESVLLEHLASLPSATVRRGLEVVDVVPTATDVVVRLKDVRTGRENTIVTQHLVAADGARSGIRSALGIELEGSDGLVEGVRAEFRAPLWGWLGEHRHGVYGISEPEAAGTLLPAGPGDRWLYGFESPVAQRPEPAEVEQIMRRRIGLAIGADVPVDLRRIDWFSSGAKIAAHYSRGRVHLAGDAAHQATPRGGTGLNTAIADGRDVGWRLGWVLRGWAPVSLLDGYEAERRPIALHTVQRSADPEGSRRTVLGELQVDLGGRLPHAWVGDRSTLDLLGPGLTLFLGPDAPHPDTTPGPPVEVVRLHGITALALGLGLRDSLLVRPDGVPVGAGFPVGARRPTHPLMISGGSDEK
jgi:2-polyprenyl-6-methoxyphenol hydroxylase-like FAD-dependent oxidoreductase